MKSYIKILFIICLLAAGHAEITGNSQETTENLQSEKIITDKAQEKLEKLKRSREEDRLNALPPRLTSYKPIYYIDGVKTNQGIANALVNISFKYRVIEGNGLFIGYTQLMFWDRARESFPFRDINYNPELFYRWDLNQGVWKSIDFGFYEHKSNGRDGPDSRTIDRQYIQMHLEAKYLAIFGLQNTMFLDYKYFKLWEGNLADNPDIGKYIGNSLGRVTIIDYLNFGSLSDTELYCEFFAGGQNKMDFSRGAVEVGYIFNLNFWGLNPRIYVQSYNGYAHSLLEYNRLEHALRIGLILTG